MLLGQQRGRREDGDLFAACDSHEGCPQRHFGFAKSHVAANQTVHGPRRDHVLNRRMDRCALIGRLFKAKVFGKTLVIVWRIAKGMALPCGAAGIDVEQLRSCVAHLFRCFFPGFFPLT